MKSTKLYTIRELYNIGAIRIGKFILSSGLESPYYVDLRLALSYPTLVGRICDLMVEAVGGLEFEHVVGVATGGLPWATILAYRLSKPLAYVRKEPKEHGTARSLEGVVKAGSSALVVDDVLTTGLNISSAVELLRSKNVGDISALVILDREQCGRARLEEAGVKVISILRISEVLEELARDNSELLRLVDYVRSTRCPCENR